MKTFIYENDLYVRCIPGKKLFNSTLIHEVVNRGDVFAVRLRDNRLTIIPGTAVVQHCDAEVTNIQPQLL